MTRAAEAYLIVDARGALSGCCCRRLADKVPDGHGDFRAMGLEREVAGIEEANIRTGDITLVSFSPRRQEEWIVAPPHRQQRWFTITEVGLEVGIERDVTGVVEEQVKLRFVRPWARHVEVVERIAVGRNR